MIRLDNGCEIEIIEETGRFVGIGAVRIAGVDLRDGAYPWVLRLETPDGILYPELLIDELVETDEGMALTLTAVGLPWGAGEYRDDYEQQLLWVRPAERIEDRVLLRFRPEQAQLDGEDFHGFSYSIAFHSDEREIHHLLSLGSWELGGSIAGNTVLNQGQCNMPVFAGGVEEMFTTTCLNALSRYGDPTQVSYQLGSRGGLLQAFDFQYSAAGVLFQWWPEMSMVASWCESPAGDSRLHVADDYRFTLAGDVEVPAKQVLFRAGAVDEATSRNLWLAAYNLVYGTLRDRFGVEETVVRPEGGVPFSVRFGGREERQVDGRWQAEGDAGGDRLELSCCGTWVTPERLPHAIADLALPRLAEAGIRRFFPTVMNESDVTELGKKRKLDDGVHGDLHCSSVCATHRFRPAEFWGGFEAWRYMAAKARELGIEVGAWFAPHFSPRTPFYREHPEWRMIGASTTPASGGYSFKTLVGADWNTPIYDAVLADMRRWAEEGGLDYLFTDSFSNLGLAGVNYRADMRHNFEALGRLYHDLQALGIKAHSFESVSPWGIGRFGVQDLRGDLHQEKDAVPGQNDFGWWLGHEDMMFNCCLHAHDRERSVEELQRCNFRANANRGFIMWAGLESDDCRYPDWYVRANHVYEQALPHMRRRRILPNDAGVEWTGEDGRRVRWCYRDQEVHTTGAERLTGDGCEPATGAPARLQAGQVYRLPAAGAGD